MDTLPQNLTGITRQMPYLAAREVHELLVVLVPPQDDLPTIIDYLSATTSAKD